MHGFRKIGATRATTLPFAAAEHDRITPKVAATSMIVLAGESLML